MIAHIVLLSLVEEPGAELTGIMAGLAGLQQALSGFESFRCGSNLDFEGMSAEYDYGLIMMFKNAEALSVYADDETHRALGARLLALCRGGRAGLKVVDLEV